MDVKGDFEPRSPTVPAPSGEKAASTPSGQGLPQGFPTATPVDPPKLTIPQVVGAQSEPAVQPMWMQTGVHYPEVI